MPPAQQPIVIKPDDLDVRTQALGGLAIVDHVLGRLRFDALVSSYLPDPDPRSVVCAAKAAGVLVRNLALGRQPLYGLAAWAAGYPAALLGLEPTEVAGLNDDRVGRALDQLFVADRASLLTALTLAAVRGFAVNLDQLHNDSTSITLHGAYQDATGRSRAGQRAPAAARGHSKDHRPDLKQLVWILTVSADGAVPITYRMGDGNTEDSTTHVQTWDTLAELVGRPGFLYIADCKLATREAMDHIAGHGGRFLTVLPRSRNEDEVGRAWLATAPTLAEVARRPGRRKHDPDEVTWAAPAPTPSAEGYRVVWVRSADKQARDAAIRVERIERATTALQALAQAWASPRCRVKTRQAAEDQARQAVEQAGASRWVAVEVSEQEVVTHRQERRGRPGKHTRYRRVSHRRFTLDWSIDHARVRYDAASDGCFPFITNDWDLCPAELLAAYKAQPRLERRHALLKGVIQAAPVLLKSDLRVDALGFCLYAAQLTHALIELDLRRAMAAAGLGELPLYPEDRACRTPTATQVLEIFAPLTRTLVCYDGQLLKVAGPTLTPLQRQLLHLLNIPETTFYRSGSHA